MPPTIRNAWLLCGMLACGVCAAGANQHTPRKQSAAQVAASAQASQPTPAAAQPAPPEPPPVPEQLPATPPKVTLTGGLLSIVADNSTLGDVLSAVKNLTGAGVEAPGAASVERVVAHLGPGQPQQVLGQLLAGSKFDYIILGSENNPAALQKIIITQPGGGAANSPGNVASARNVSPPARTGSPRELGLNEGLGDEQTPEAGVEEEVQQEPPQPEPQPQAEETPQQEQPNPNGPKTPEQLLQELQRQQQQGQATRPDRPQ